MKKLLALFLILVMLLPVGALADGIVEIDSVRDYGDCTFTIHFNNPNNGKTVVLAFHENYDSAGSSLTGSELSSSASSYTFYDLAPGETYTFYLMNDWDFSTADSFTYTVSNAPKYNSNDLRLYDLNLCYFRPDSVQGDYSYNYANDLSASKIESMLENQQFLLKVDFRHSVFNSTFDLDALAVVKSPSGHVSTNATTITITKNCTGFWQTMMYMNNAFEEMIEHNGSIPTGKYEVEIYVDGMLLGTDSFSITAR